MVKDNIRLGELKITLPPNKSVDENAIDVRFTYDVNGLLEVLVKHVETGKTDTLVIQGNGGMMSPEQIQARFKELEKIKLHPRDTLEIRTMLARADRIYQQLRGDIRQWLGQKTTSFEGVLETQDARQIAQAKRRFQEILDSIENDNRIHTDLNDE